MVLSLLRRLGFIISLEKCNLEPSTTFTYLGVVWNTDAWKVRLKVILKILGQINTNIFQPKRGEGL